MRRGGPTPSEAGGQGAGGDGGGEVGGDLPCTSRGGVEEGWEDRGQGSRGEEGRTTGRGRASKRGEVWGCSGDEGHHKRANQAGREASLSKRGTCNMFLASMTCT